MIIKNIIRVANFNIGIELHEETRSYIKNIFINMYIKKYKNFLVQDSPKLDFTIKIKSTDLFAMIIRQDKERIKKYFYLNFVIDERNRIAYTTYYISEIQFDTLMKTILYGLLNKNNGFFMHGSAVLYKNKALLFVGKSGAGKSTITKMLSTNMPKLADDIFIIRKIKNVYYFFQTPFFETNWNYFRTKKIYLISNFFFLSQANNNHIKNEKDQHQIFSKLFKQIIFENKSITKRQFKLINTLITNYHFSTLKFTLQRKTVTRLLNQFLNYKGI